MIKHIVMWKLKEENKSTNALELSRRLKKLTESIPEIKYIETGIHIDIQTREPLDSSRGAHPASPPQSAGKPDVLHHARTEALADTTVPPVPGLNRDEHVKSSKSKFDFILITHFESESDLMVYREHPEHKKVVKFVKEITEGAAAVDFKS